MMDQARLAELLEAFGSRRIAVVGDFFLDRYLDFDPELAEVSLETGKTANQVVGVRHSPGAAGTVVCNLAALQAGTVLTLGFTGDDGEGYELRQDLTRLGCATEHLFVVPDRRTPTYLKPRNVRVPGLEGEAERYDTKNRDPLPPEVESRIICSLEQVAPGAHAVIVMDQVEEEGCGVVTAAVREHIAGLARRNSAVVFWADSRRRIGAFSNVIIKPNAQEAVAAAFGEYSGPVDNETVRRAGRVLSSKSGKAVFVTRSECGMLVFEGDSEHEVAGVPVEGPIDPTGAGDSATAAAVLTLASGGSCVEAALMANLVASITVQQIGTTGTARPDELPARLEMWLAQAGS